MVGSFAKTIAALNTTSAHNQKILKSRNLNKSILKKLYEINFITHYTITNKTTTVYLRSKKEDFLKIQNFYRKNSKLYISYNQIVKKKMHLSAAPYFISSPSGIITQYEAKTRKSGGFLVAKISFK